MYFSMGLTRPTIKRPCRARSPTSSKKTGPEGHNEAPRSKLRGITELKHSELPEIFLRLPLPLHIPLDSLPVCPFPYRGHIVPVGPKLPAPQYPLHSRLSAKNLPRRDALEYLHNPAGSHFRMRTAEQMDVILVRPNRFHLDRKPFRDLGSRLLDNRRHHLIQQRFPVFHGKDNMVVDLLRTVRSLSDCLVPLVRHTPEGTRKDCPRSKLRGITSSHALRVPLPQKLRLALLLGHPTGQDKQCVAETVQEPHEFLIQRLFPPQPHTSTLSPSADRSGLV